MLKPHRRKPGFIMVQYIVDNKDFLTIIISCCSLITSLAAIALSITSTILQNKFNRNSVQPFCDIFFETYMNCSNIEICNNGLGVMIIEEIYFYDNVEKQKKKLADIFKNISFKTYCERTFNQSSIMAGGKEKIFEASLKIYMNWIKQLKD